jgi:hypothetical protein
MIAIFLRTLFAVTLLLCLPLQVSAATLSPFESDGCSAFPNGTFQQNELWLSCCVEHDYAYWKGGTYDERATADDALRACVAAAGEPAIAKLMLAGVRVGGTPYLPTRFRWGYGWPFPRGYKALSEEEQEQVKTLTASIGVVAFSRGESAR